MRHRHPLPKIWLMTDPRIGNLTPTIARLPRGSGIVFRHYELPEGERRRLFKSVKQAARKGRHVLILADTPARAMAWGADGAHNRSVKLSRGLRTVAVHHAREAALARRVRADLIFVSPVFDTRSHADAPTLGRVKLGFVAKGQHTIALGGLSAKRFTSLAALKLYGWGGIDALSLSKG
jgi:thiamine-phosphate pyrophosphorylase